MKKKIFAALASVMLLGTTLTVPVSAQENSTQPSDAEETTELSDWNPSNYRIMKQEEVDFIEHENIEYIDQPEEYYCYCFTKSQNPEESYKILGIKGFSYYAGITCKNTTPELLKAEADAIFDDTYNCSFNNEHSNGVIGTIRARYSIDSEFEEKIAAYLAALQAKNVDISKASCYIEASADWICPGDFSHLTYVVPTTHLEEDKAAIRAYIEENALPWQLVENKRGLFYVDLLSALATPEQQLEMARQIYHDLGFKMRYSCPEVKITVPFNEKVLIEPEYQMGDVNMDGKVDIEDAQLVCEAYVIYMGGGDCILSEEQIVLASITNTTTSHYIDKETVPFSIADALILSYYYCFKNVSMIIDDSVSVDDFYNDLERYIGTYLERGD